MVGWMEGWMDGRMDAGIGGKRTEQTVLWEKFLGPGSQVQAVHQHQTQQWTDPSQRSMKPEHQAAPTKPEPDWSLLVKAAFIGRYQPGIRQCPHFCFQRSNTRGSHREKRRRLLDKLFRVRTEEGERIYFTRVHNWNNRDTQFSRVNS